MKKLAILLIAIGIMAISSITVHASIISSIPSGQNNALVVTKPYYVKVVWDYLNDGVWKIDGNSPMDQITMFQWDTPFYGKYIYENGQSNIKFYNVSNNQQIVMSSLTTLMYYGGAWHSGTKSVSNIYQAYIGQTSTEALMYDTEQVLEGNVVIYKADNTNAFTPPPPPNQTSGDININLIGHTSDNFILNVKDKDSIKLQATVNFPLWKNDFSIKTHSYNWIWKIEGTDDNNLSYQYSEKPLNGVDGLIDTTIGYMQDYLVFTPYFKIGTLGNKTIKVTCTNEFGLSISDTIIIRLVSDTSGTVTGTIIPSGFEDVTGGTIVGAPIETEYSDDILGKIKYVIDNIKYWALVPINLTRDLVVDVKTNIQNLITDMSKSMDALKEIFSALPSNISRVIAGMVSVIVLITIIGFIRKG